MADPTLNILAFGAYPDDCDLRAGGAGCHAPRAPISCSP